MPEPKTPPDRASPLALLTGGAGFIGSHIVDRLLADGYRVRVLDDFSTGRRENLPDHDSLEVITGDVGDFPTVLAVTEGVTTVFHEAAIASVPKTIEDPLGSQRTNYLGTLNVLEAARRTGARRVVFASSAAVYGDLPGLPKREDMPVRPLSPYAVDKLASEHAMQVYHRLHGIETVCLRYFNVYGPRQDPSSPYSGVISIFAEKLSRGERPVIYGDGEQTRDFVYVSDVVEANILASRSTDAVGTIINIGTGITASVKHILQLIMCRYDAADRPCFADRRHGDIQDSCADINLAQALLGWKPDLELREGLKQKVYSG
jgi:UDP-glucose 4-epimerase